MISNPFDSEENLQALFDLNPEYIKAKRLSFEKYVEKNNLKADFLMTLKEQYLKLVGFITKNTIAATILMILVVASATATAAEIALPKGSNLKPSNILQNSLGNKAGKPIVEENKAVESEVKPESPQNTAGITAPELAITNEPYIKLVTAKHWDDKKDLNDSSHNYVFFYEKINIKKGSYLDDSGNLTNGYKIKIYDGKIENLPKTKSGEYSAYEVNLSGIYDQFDLKRSDIQNFKQVCTITLLNDKPLENTKSCVSLPENRPSTLLQIENISNAIKCPESLDISKETQIVCQLNLPKDKTTEDTLYYRDFDFGLDRFSLGRKSLTAKNNQNLPIQNCTTLKSEIRCGLSTNAIEQIKVIPEGFSNNLSLLISNRRGDLMMFTSVGSEIKVLNQDSINKIWDKIYEQHKNDLQMTIEAKYLGENKLKLANVTLNKSYTLSFKEDVLIDETANYGDKLNQRSFQMYFIPYIINDLYVRSPKIKTESMTESVSQFFLTPQFNSQGAIYDYKQLETDSLYRFDIKYSLTENKEAKSSPLFRDKYDFYLNQMDVKKINSAYEYIPEVKPNNILELKSYSTLQNVPLKNASSFQDVKGIIDFKPIGGSCSNLYNRWEIEGNIRDNTWYPQNYVVGDPLNYGILYYFSPIDKKTGDPCVKFGKNENLKIKVEKDGKTTYFDLQTNITPFGRAKSPIQNSESGLLLDTLDLFDNTVSQKIKSGKYDQYGQFINENPIVITEIVLGNEIELTTKGFKDFETGQNLNNQQCSAEFNKLGKLVYKTEGDVIDGVCKIKFALSEKTNITKGDIFDIIIASNGFNNYLKSNSGVYKAK